MSQCWYSVTVVFWLEGLQSKDRRMHGSSGNLNMVIERWDLLPRAYLVTYIKLGKSPMPSCVNIQSYTQAWTVVMMMSDGGRGNGKISNSQVYFCPAWETDHLFFSPFVFVSCLRLVEGKKGVKVENRPFLSKLIFFNVSEHDYGNYTCVASNKLGHTNASITLFGETVPWMGPKGLKWGQVDGGGTGKEGLEGRVSDMS